jgi:hypothetical protein
MINGDHNLESPKFTSLNADIPEGHELVGVKLTLDDEGFVTCLNFLLWPSNFEIVDEPTDLQVTESATSASCMQHRDNTH